jgi:hypothetical protein
MKRKLVRFDDVRDAVASAHDQNLDDIVVDLGKVRITPNIELEIPKTGTFSMTEWSKRQFGAILGIQWDRWFNHISPSVIQKEIRMRFSINQSEKKIRLRKTNDSDVDGEVRAILSPSYFPIDNVRVFERMENAFKGEVSKLKFAPSSLEALRSDTDKSSHFSVFTDPVSMGKIVRGKDKEASKWYSIAESEGALPEEDWLYPGFKLRNSEVGYSALTVDEYSFRLVCLNGLLISSGNQRLLYRQHRSIEDAELDKLLKKVFTAAPERWDATIGQMRTLREAHLPDARLVLEDVLARMSATKKFREEAFVAYSKEPLGTKYGVLQAITRAAQNYEDVDKRSEFESMAGKYLAAA